MGMAKPMPSMDASLLEKVLVPLEYLALMMPMTSPYWLNRGPPELPELTVQSVWSSFMAVPSLMEMARSLALTTPVVRVLARVPRALPMAVTLSPTVREELSPRTTAGKVVFLPAFFTFRTAVSRSESLPTTSAS